MSPAPDQRYFIKDHEINRDWWARASVILAVVFEASSGCCYDLVPFHNKYPGDGPESPSALYIASSGCCYDLVPFYKYPGGGPESPTLFPLPPPTSREDFRLTRYLEHPHAAQVLNIY
ncbi:hypothetical protein TNCV_2732531 [Trichonephila clavipes]|nr:hypothetical protein TNCV_2732531 [Trichonephila clavipes]